MPILFAGIGTILIPGLFLIGKGLYTLPLVAVAAVLFRPHGYLFAWFGVLLSCATGVKFGPLTAGDLFLIPALVLSAAWLIQQPRDRRPKVPGVLILLGLGLVVVTGIEWMANGITTLSAAYAARLVLIIVGMPVMFMVYGRTTRRFEGLLAAYVLSAALNGVLAELDAIGIHLASRLTGRAGFTHSERFSGLSLHTTQLGMLGVLAVPMMVYLARQNRIWYVAAAPILVGVLASGSRGALLGVPIALIVLALCERKRRVRTVVSIGVLGIVVLAAANALGLTVGFSRLLGVKSASASDTARLEHAATALHDIAQRPLFGYGFGTPFAHDTYLELLRDGGLIVGVSIFALWFWAFVTAYRTHRAVAYVPAAAVMTWIILNAQFNGVYERYLWIPFGAAVGIAALIRSGTLDLADEPRRVRGVYRPELPTGNVALTGGG